MHRRVGSLSGDCPVLLYPVFCLLKPPKAEKATGSPIRGDPVVCYGAFQVICRPAAGTLAAAAGYIPLRWCIPL